MKLVELRVLGKDALKFNAKASFLRLFPIVNWISRYNFQWFLRDAVAGITMGTLAVPHAIAFARLAGLPTEHGLYTAFCGTLAYAIFSTSKDVTIGMTSVLSILANQLYNDSTNQSIDPVVWQCALAFVSGLIQFCIGFFGLGIIVDLISVPVVIGFTTGAGLQIMITQIPSLFGIPNINTNSPPYLVLFNSIASLPQARLDTLFGLATVVFLILLRYFSNYMVNKGKTNFIWVKFLCYFIGLVLATAVSFLCFQGRSRLPIRVVGTVPQGLKYFKAPDFSLLPSLFVPSLSIVVVGIVDHIAIAKAFGRLNGYRVDSNQEIIALGIGNMFSPFLGGYCVTGSFSRSSVKSRSGVKSPFSGFITSSLVLLSIYFLTPTFFYMPSASLAAVIIVSISDLIARPSVVKELVELDLNDLIGFLLAALVTIFVNIEIGIFASVGYSILVLVFRIARPKVAVLFRNEESSIWYERKDSIAPGTISAPGIVVFRMKESLTYPNSNYLAQYVKDWIEDHTDAGNIVTERELLWCESSRNTFARNQILKSIVFDFSSVNYMDASGVQLLLDIKFDAERWSSSRVLMFFAHVHDDLLEDVEYFLKKSKQIPHGSPCVDEIEDCSLRERFVYTSIEEAVKRASGLDGPEA
jgi:sodium-independent sulfate anion transporter 11